jgi:hypothetical protein
MTLGPVGIWTHATSKPLIKNGNVILNLNMVNLFVFIGLEAWAQLAATHQGNL